MRESKNQNSSSYSSRYHRLLLFAMSSMSLSSLTADASTSSASPSAPSSLSSTSTKRLTVESMNKNLLKMEYAVRGPVVIAADKINDELKQQQQQQQQHGATSQSSNNNKYPFDHIIYTNIGNPHSVGQAPLTWPRQVLALVDLPDAVGVNHPDAPKLFPPDAIRRAQEIKTGLMGHGSGAYSHSQGAQCFRNDVAQFIQRRDNGVASDASRIFLTNGASEAIRMVLQTLVANVNCGTMIPVPQYPIYSATLDLLNAHKVGYYMDEESDWSLNVEELERALEEAKSKGIEVNSFVLINPGNPTGQVLTKENVKDIVSFCARHRLVLLADEVYQENVYEEGAAFYSAKRAAHDLGLLHNDGSDAGIELVSFHSVSKGVFGECGRRGGYMELVGIDSGVVDQLYKLASSSLCSTVSGQVMTSLMVRGPDFGSESYESHEAEKKAVFDSLKRRAKLVGDGLNSIEGFSCRSPKGSMYCFPSVKMPPGVFREAESRGVSPDTVYAVSLLEATGICVVPASGFHQREGRYGFRTTFLPSEEEMSKAVEMIRGHYKEFCARYA
ncbi:hypothetical protein MPSEU_000359200 [Mayamaea pseudoterrestris]|nr:hypothetical protein MPSEU_000359200 [Mayamaea pseudoterrestris]